MPYTLKWDDADHTILTTAFQLPWTWDEYVESTHQAAAMITDHTIPVDVINYPSDGKTSMPKGNPLVAFRGEAPLMDLPHVHLWLVASAMPPITRTMVQIFMTMIPKAKGRVHFAYDLDDARTQIRARRTALSSVPSSQ